MSSILVTGGCGFVGANLVPKLVHRGATVRVLDNMSGGSSDNLSGTHVDVTVGDIRDRTIVADTLAGVDVVVHLAASGSVVESIVDPLENFDINVSGTLTMLQESVKADVRKFIFASTGGALIGNATPPVNEQSLPWPISPYGASKLCGEAYCHAFAGSYGLDAVALRFANVFGPHSDHKKGAVTAFITSALRWEPPTIFGDGTASRDFLYVDDLCKGIMAAIDAPLSDEVLHLASGKETSIATIAHLVLELTGRTEVPIYYEERRHGEVERNFATAGRAQELLGFVPATPLRRGMEKTVDWFIANRARWRTAG